MGDFEEKSRKNVRALESEINVLSSRNWLSSRHWDFFERDYKEFWAHAKVISQMFKTLKPIKREDRERLWEKFSLVREQAKSKQKSEHEKRQFKSGQHKSFILKEAESARPCSLFGFAPPDVQEMKTLGRVLKNASSMLSQYKGEMFGEHKQECFDRIQEIRRIHDFWWNELKKHRSRCQEEFQQRVRANLEKNYERHKKASDELQSMRSRADDLRDKISSAWNDDFRDRAYGWLSKTEDKIRDIEDSIQRIENWIREDENKLR